MVNMKAKVDSFALGLQEMIMADGDNLSVGERQLLCVARALLRKSRILILDEATASIDMENDQLITHCIRDQFAACTILAVAHRLATIIDYDRILVLDHGRVAEFDTPCALLDKPQSLFRQLVDATGPASAEHLEATARAAHAAKHAQAAH